MIRRTLLQNPRLPGKSHYHYHHLIVYRPMFIANMVSTFPQVQSNKIVLFFYF